ncbi:hypothetical protein NPIL_197671 [Nephila pilipes]|uniref:Uncharacterized protein n=1 Tax=Nephila pilipes TaxID=299642 RepID=A0A8X6THN8_NEPPI|nr:hypothetical protein NPIL_197671 [Nephila pilipes]
MSSRKEKRAPIRLSWNKDIHIFSARAQFRHHQCSRLKLPKLESGDIVDWAKIYGTDVTIKEVKFLTLVSNRFSTALWKCEMDWHTKGTALGGKFHSSLKDEMTEKIETILTECSSKQESLCKKN